jgi:hypothetical protein
MILAVLDDLMFTSKIKTTAGQLGVAVTFARSADGALAEMRKAPPSLVILDLNSARTNPLAIVAGMKQDPALASIRRSATRPRPGGRHQRGAAGWCGRRVARRRSRRTLRSSSVSHERQRPRIDILRARARIGLRPANPLMHSPAVRATGTRVSIKLESAQVSTRSSRGAFNVIARRGRWTASRVRW